MFTTYEKSFTNNATTPVRVYVTAIVEEAGGKITDIVRSGGSVPKHKSMNDAVTAEANRMHEWVRSTFIGQDIACLQSHNGVVPAPWFVPPVGRLTYPNLLCEMENAARRAMRCHGVKPNRMFFTSGNADCLGLDQSDHRFSIVNIDSIDDESILKNMERKSAFHRQLADALRREAARNKPELVLPRVGTYWQRNSDPSRLTVAVLSVSELLDGKYAVTVKRVDAGQEKNEPYTLVVLKPWADNWTRVYGIDVRGRPELAESSMVFLEKGTVYATFGGRDPINVGDLTDGQIAAIEREHKRDFPAVRSFLESHREMEQERNPRKIRMPAAMGEPYGVQDDTEQQAVQLEAGADYYQQFLNSVDSSGVNEMPPRVEERYFSVVSGNIYKVVGVSRKPYSREYYVTMERTSDSHRTKFTFRNHALWLAVWRPVDHEEKAREVVQVEVDTAGKTLEDCKQRFDNVQSFNGSPFAPLEMRLKISAEDAEAVMQKIGEAAHVAAEELLAFAQELDEDGVLDDLVRIYDELHRRMPGWNDKSQHEPGRTEADLAIRAIRAINKHMLNYQGLANELSEKARGLAEENRRLREANAGLEQQNANTEKKHRDDLIESLRAARSVLGTSRCRELLSGMPGGVTPIYEMPNEELSAFVKVLLKETIRAAR